MSTVMDVVDLQDVVALGNILDGLLVPSGGGVYTADTDADSDWDEADYDLLYRCGCRHSAFKQSGQWLEILDWKETIDRH